MPTRTVLLPHEAEQEGDRPPPLRRRRWPLLALLAIAVAIVGVLVPLAPVSTDAPVINWPKAGELPQNTLVPLVPYRPASFSANVPCSALHDLATRGGGEALRTRDVRAAPASPGLVVSVAAAHVRIVSGDRILLDEPLPPAPCTYRVVADGSGTAVSRDGTLLTHDPVPPPQTEKLQTDLAQFSAGRGLQVQVRPDARFNSSPSALKTALLVLEVVLLLALMAVAVRRWPGRRSPAAERPQRSLRPHPADVLVALVSVGWLFLGPMNIDDGWYLEMALSGRQTGFIGNTVGQYSVAENPFVLSQYLMQLWSSHGWSLLEMRLLVGLMGFATYLLLRRVMRLLLGRLGQRRRLRRAVWFLALAHLLWWLPYGLTLRPEPVIVLGSAGVLLLAETARQRRSFGILALAVALAAVTTTASPSGLVAWAPLVVQLPWVFRELVEARWRDRLTAALVLLAAPTAAVPIAFADASLGTVLATHATQRTFYPDFRWYDEILQIAGLFAPGDVAAWGRRLPVFLSVACAALAVAGARGAARPGRPGSVIGTSLTRVAAMIGLSAAALSLSPTKWVPHYGALAAFGTLALALTMLRFPLSHRGWSMSARLAGTLLVSAALAAAFAGPNLWRPITDWGQPFGKHPSTSPDPARLRQFLPHVGPFFASSIVLWVLLAVVAFVVLSRRVNRRSAANSTGSVLLTTGSLFGALLMVAVFVVAPLRQHPAWSLASSNLHALTGHDCGLADSVRVDVDGRAVTVQAALAGQPVLVDIKVRPVWPCLTSTTVSDGMLQLPRFRVLAGEGYASDTNHIYRTEQRGGVDAILNREAQIVPLQASQQRTGPDQTSFGSIERIDYSLPAGLYDLELGHRQVPGWTIGSPVVPPEDSPTPEQ